MKLEIIKKSWYKRRMPEKEKEITSVSLNGFKKEYNHLCTLTVEYKSAPTATFISRVIYDRGWIVDGGHVSVRVI